MLNQHFLKGSVRKTKNVQILKGSVYEEPKNNCINPWGESKKDKGKLYKSLKVEYEKERKTVQILQGSVLETINYYTNPEG